MRRATDADIPALLDMAREFHAHVKPPWPLDDDAFSACMAALMRDGFVAISADGFIAGALAQNPLSRDWLVASEFLWWAKGSGAGLLRAFRRWAKDMGAREIRLSCPPETRASRLFARCGAPVEAIYSEVLTCA